MPTEASTGNGDQRVTNAVLLNAIKDLKEDMKEIASDFKKDHDKLTGYCERVDVNSKEIGNLRGQNMLISFGVSVATNLLAHFGFNK